MSETEILDAVERYFDGFGPCAMLRQVVLDNRRADAVIVTDRGYRVGIEAKSSRADYRNESDDKRAAVEMFTNTCWYAAPPGVIDPATLPAGWGLLVVETPIKVLLAAQPTPRSGPVLPTHANDLLWRCWRVEQRVEPGSIGEARKRIEELETTLGYARESAARERARAEDAASQVLALAGPQDCAECGHPLQYVRTRGWCHEAAVEAVCGPQRAARYRQRREADTGAAYVLGKPPPPYPAALASRPDPG